MELYVQYKIRTLRRMATNKSRNILLTSSHTSNLLSSTVVTSVHCTKMPHHSFLSKGSCDVCVLRRLPRLAHMSLNFVLASVGVQKLRFHFEKELFRWYLRREIKENILDHCLISSKRTISSSHHL